MMKFLLGALALTSAVACTPVVHTDTAIVTFIPVSRGTWELNWTDFMPPSLTCKGLAKGNVRTHFELPTQTITMTCHGRGGTTNAVAQIMPNAQTRFTQVNIKTDQGYLGTKQVAY